MIIDFHTHVFPPFFREHGASLFSDEPDFRVLYGTSDAKIAGVRQLLRDMDEGEIERSVVFGFPWRREDLYRRHNDYILDAVHRHPERLIGFCCFSPLSPGGPAEAERCLEAGLSGVGELAVYGSGLSAEIAGALREVLVQCAARDAVMLLHTNEPVGHDYPGKTPMTLSEIYRFLKTCPENRIVLAHWGGGLFFYGLMKKETKEVLRNVWFDTAASPYLYTPDIYRVAGEVIGYDKILFGSDYPLLKPKRYFDEMISSGLSPDRFRQITGGNAADLLGYKKGPSL
jgi:predicted TIM-barrel fold metal-dependent hydrolase